MAAPARVRRWPARWHVGSIVAIALAAGINGAITQQGVQISFNNIFYLMGWIILGLIAVIWLARPPFVPKAGPAASGGH